MEFEINNKSVDFEYQSYSDYNLRTLREKFGFDKIAGLGDEFQQQRDLMKWCSKKLYKGNGPISFIPGTCMDIINAVEKDNMSMNCYAHALALNETFLSMNFKTKIVFCMPLDLRTTECHCITHVYSSVFKKWIIMDSANECFYLNSKGIPLSIRELRNALIFNEKIRIPGKNLLEADRMLNYWRKNSIRYLTYAKSTCNIKGQQNKILYYLNPKLLVFKDKVINTNETVEQCFHFYNDQLFWEN